MEYWRGGMNWPLKSDWRCEVCGSVGVYAGLTWGMPHSRCRCNVCHTEYLMRNWALPERPIVDVPIIDMRDEFLVAAKAGWSERAGKNPFVDEWDKAKWMALGVPAEAFVRQEEEE